MTQESVFHSQDEAKTRILSREPSQHIKGERMPGTVRENDIQSMNLVTIIHEKVSERPKNIKTCYKSRLEVVKQEKCQTFQRFERTIGHEMKLDTEQQRKK